MAGEDFAYFANEVPGFYFRLGVVKPGTTSGGLHTPDFRADDGAIAVGMRAMAQLVLEIPPTRRDFEVMMQITDRPRAATVSPSRGSRRRNVYWNLPPAQLYEQAVRRGEAAIAAEGPLVCRPATTPAARPRTSSRCDEPSSERRHLVGQQQPADRRREVRSLLRADEGVRGAERPLRLRRLRRRRRALSAAGSGHHRIRLAQPVRAQHVRARGRPGQARRLRARVHGDRLPGGRTADPAKRRHPLRDLHRSRPGAPHGPDRRHRSTPARSRRASSR